MATPSLDHDKHRLIKKLKEEHLDHRTIAKVAGVGVGTVSKYARLPLESIAPVVSDKKVGKMDWRKWCEWAEAGQQLKHEASWSQERATVELGDGKSPIALTFFSDQHIGSWGTDYSGFVNTTNIIKSIPNLYCILGGDPQEMAIKMRSVLETCSQIFTPEQQDDFIENWFDEIHEKVIASVWDNHSVERMEKLAGVSTLKRIISRKAIWFNGIGHIDIKVGGQVYHGAISHKFRGGSKLDATAGPKNYMRFEAPDREFAIQGDTHRSGLSKYNDGGLRRVALNSGTLHLNSGYAKRYFSQQTFPDFPVIEFYPDEHLMVPYISIEDWFAATGRRGGV